MTIGKIRTTGTNNIAWKKSSPGSWSADSAVSSPPSSPEANPAFFRHFDSIALNDPRKFRFAMEDGTMLEGVIMRRLNQAEDIRQRKLPPGLVAFLAEGSNASVTVPSAHPRYVFDLICKIEPEMGGDAVDGIGDMAKSFAHSIKKCTKKVAHAVQGKKGGHDPLAKSGEHMVFHAQMVADRGRGMIFLRDKQFGIVYEWFSGEPDRVKACIIDSEGKASMRYCDFGLTLAKQIFSGQTRLNREQVLQMTPCTESTTPRLIGRDGYEPLPTPPESSLQQAESSQMRFVASAKVSI